MQIPTKEIRDGSHNGKVYFICHYNRPDMHKKSLRSVPPTKCLVTSNEELPDNKRVYYSESHFVPYTNAGKLSKKVISPVDNTGYRSHVGNELFVFDNYEECSDEWNSQINKHLLVIDDIIANVKQQWIIEKQNLQNKLITK